MSMTVERPLGRDQGRDLDIYQIFGRIQGKSVARSRRGEKLVLSQAIELLFDRLICQTTDNDSRIFLANVI